MEASVYGVLALARDWSLTKVRTPVITPLNPLFEKERRDTGLDSRRSLPRSCGAGMTIMGLIDVFVILKS